ncbi:unnamed protein product [Ilex paraguariensis]|uniref:Uncharacterized protein n=1 Tax=Ilex paraguariensis TaxID=185542 RepID=A0ABC8S5K7_9AQUA
MRVRYVPSSTFLVAVKFGHARKVIAAGGVQMENRKWEKDKDLGTSMGTNAKTFQNFFFLMKPLLSKPYHWSAASILASWKPPSDGVVKVNFCDLEFLEGQTVGIGAVLRDIRGVFLAGMARKHMRREEVWSVDGHSYARSGKFCSPPRDSVCSVGRGLHSFSEVCCGHKF